MNVIILESGPSPFFDGWRHYQHHHRRGVSVCICQPKAARAFAARSGAKLFPAGTWEASAGIYADKWPGISPAVQAEIDGVKGGAS